MINYLKVNAVRFFADKYGKFTGCLTVLVLIFSSAAFGAKWNYPEPDADRDLKDISFYTAPEDNKVLCSKTSGKPRNVILMIGDGMGFNHVSLARYRSVGADGRLHMETLPVTGILRTRSASSSVTDSAAAGTALATGHKTNNKMLGLLPTGQSLMTILEAAEAKGFKTGLVATSAITHATPASFASHVQSRYMNDRISQQMLERDIEVMLAGGREFFLPEPQGSRKDSRNLIKKAQTLGYTVIYNKQGLDKVSKSPVLGLFAEDGLTTFSPEPMLADMSEAAVRLLSSPEDKWFAQQPRFFVMIEGSQIDWACHANDEDNMVRQMLLFDMAVKKMIDFAVSDKHTLVIITADHECGGLLLKENGKDLAASWGSKNHTASDVPIYAFGPGSERFMGILDNTQIPVVIAELLSLEHVKK